MILWLFPQAHKKCASVHTTLTELPELTCWHHLTMAEKVDKEALCAIPQAVHVPCRCKGRELTFLKLHKPFKCLGAGRALGRLGALADLLPCNQHHLCHWQTRLLSEGSPISPLPSPWDACWPGSCGRPEKLRNVPKATQQAGG